MYDYDYWEHLYSKECIRIPIVFLRSYNWVMMADLSQVFERIIIPQRYNQISGYGKGREAYEAIMDSQMVIVKNPKDTWKTNKTHKI